MPTATSPPLVSLSVTGLMLICLNKEEERKYGNCEFGVIECPEHELTLFIEKITRDPDTGESSGELVEHSINRTRDIVIEAINARPHPWLNDDPQSYQPGVRRHLPADSFRRSEETDDRTDFRWVVDLEGEELHNRKLSVVKRPRSIVAVNDGLLYTEKLPDEHFARVLTEDDSRMLFGKLAHIVGLDICAEKVLIGNKDAAAIALVSAPDTSYKVVIENRCLRPAREYGSNNIDPLSGTGRSDFIFYYDVIEAPDGKLFDFQGVVKNNGITNFGLALNDDPEFSLCGPTDPCHPGFLGMTTGISGE